MHKKNLLEIQIHKEGPRVWPRQRLGPDACAIVVESEHSGWPLSAQASGLRDRSRQLGRDRETRLRRIRTKVNRGNDATVTPQ